MLPASDYGLIFSTVAKHSRELRAFERPFQNCLSNSHAFQCVKQSCQSLACIQIRTSG